MAKAKRKLSEINFEAEGSHIALVGKAVGGPANGADYALVMKACDFSDEFVHKASQIKVTMEITEYLSRFYGLWYEEAEVLARALGFTTAQMDDEAEDAAEGEKEETYQDYIMSKVQSIEVMKSLYDSENIPESLSKLNEQEYLAMLQDQLLIEKAFKQIDKGAVTLEKGCKKPPKKAAAKESDDVAKATESDASTTVDVEKSVEPSGSVTLANKETSMSKETQVVDVATEVIEKSQFDAIQKAFDEQKEQLAKALEQVATFAQEKKEALAKARKEKVLAAVKDANRAEVLFKAVGLVEDEAEFESVVKALVEMQELVEQSELFVEKGAQVEEQNDKNSVAELLKARLSK